MRLSIELKNEFYDKWVSPNGLALLNIGDPENSNGILFLAMFLILLKESDDVIQDDLFKSFSAIKKIEVEPGLFKRSPSSQELEAHDDYIGICALSVIFNLATAREIVEFGTAHGFAYDNLSPELPSPKTIRQGGDIAFYKICAGFTPTIWEFVWMCAGIILAGVRGTPSVVNLAWLRLKAISYAVFRAQTSLFGWLSTSIFFTSLIYNISVRKRFGGIQGSFAKYFIEAHPIRRLAKELEL